MFNKYCYTTANGMIAKPVPDQYKIALHSGCINTCRICCVVFSYVGLGVFVETVDETEWFNAANLTEEKQYDNVTITKKNVTQLEVSYKSGKHSHHHFKWSY